MKNTIILFLTLIFGMAGTAALAKGKKDKDADIEIYHKPLAQNFILFVPPNGLGGHLNHGDCVALVGREDPDQAELLREAVLDAGYTMDEALDCGRDDDDDDDEEPEDPQQ
ncbi:MAG: hypothetical protein RL839_13445 [Gammaproteobacteria bacterium]